VSQPDPAANQPDNAAPESALDAVAAELGPGGDLAPEADAEGYRRRMARRQEVQRQRVGERNLEKGLVLVFTGDGKGKTTAALGLALRTLGHGDAVAVVQFIKGGWQPGEAKALELFGEALHWHALGEGFTWETQDRDRDRQLVQQAWEQSLAYLADASRKLVVLDEVNVALKLGYLGIEQVLAGLDLRPELTHVALTGRGAPPQLLERADLVTEMKLVRHPFREQGVKAQRGIEF
jgi:cob(I)alamin adenosyltransferase